MKLRRIVHQGQMVGYAFWCPGCEEAHAYYTANWREGGNPVWHFNGNEDKPTFSPSLLVRTPPIRRCHIFLTDGVIHFLSDCSHKLAGQNVPLPECPF